MFLSCYASAMPPCFYFDIVISFLFIFVLLFRSYHFQFIIVFFLFFMRSYRFCHVASNTLMTKREKDIDDKAFEILKNNKNEVIIKISLKRSFFFHENHLISFSFSSLSYIWIHVLTLNRTYTLINKNAIIIIIIISFLPTVYILLLPIT